MDELINFINESINNIKNLFCKHYLIIKIGCDSQYKSRLSLWMCPHCGKFASYDKFADTWSSWKYEIPRPINKWQLKKDAKEWVDGKYYRKFGRYMPL